MIQAWLSEKRNPEAGFTTSWSMLKRSSENILKVIAKSSFNDNIC